MKKISILLIIVSQFYLLSCSDSNQKEVKDLRVIDVAGSIGGGRVVKLSEIANDIQYIPLETNDKSILGNPYTHLYFEKNILYFIQMYGKINVFEKSGRFLKVFSRYGRGPQEYDYLGNLQIDNNSQKICITSINKILEYKLDGQFVRSINSTGKSDIGGYSISSALRMNENLFVLPSSSKVASNTGYSVVAIDSFSNVILTIKYPDQEKEFVKTLTRNYWFTETYIFKFKDSVRIINGNNEYILGLSKDLLVDTSYILNYGKYNIKTADLGMRFDNKTPYLHRYSYTYESDKYMFMRFHLGSLAHKPRVMLKTDKQGAEGKTFTDPISCSIFNKKTGEFTFVDQPKMDQLGFVDDFEGGPAFWPLYISEDEYMVSCIPAIEFISYAKTSKVSEKLKKIAENLKETDNPVLVLVKLK